MKVVKTVSTWQKGDPRRTYLLQLRYLSSKKTIQGRFPKKTENFRMLFWGEWKNWLLPANQKELENAIASGIWTKERARLFLSRLAKEVRKRYKENPKSPFRVLAVKY